MENDFSPSIGVRMPRLEFHVADYRVVYNDGVPEFRIRLPGIDVEVPRRAPPTIAQPSFAYEFLQAVPPKAQYRLQLTPQLNLFPHPHGL